MSLYLTTTFPNMTLLFLNIHSSCWAAALMKIPSSPDEFQQHLLHSKILLMASSPPGQPIQKYFFYAQEVH